MLPFSPCSDTIVCPNSSSHSLCEYVRCLIWTVFFECLFNRLDLTGALLMRIQQYSFSSFSIPIPHFCCKTLNFPCSGFIRFKVLHKARENSGSYKIKFSIGYAVLGKKYFLCRCHYRRGSSMFTESFHIGSLDFNMLLGQSDLCHCWLVGLRFTLFYLSNFMQLSVYGL